MGLDVKYCGIKNEEELFEMQATEAEEKKELDATAGHKVTRARGVN